jgi:hypothetical protein
MIAVRMAGWQLWVFPGFDCVASNLAVYSLFSNLLSWISENIIRPGFIYQISPLILPGYFRGFLLKKSVWWQGNPPIFLIGVQSL